MCHKHADITLLHPATHDSSLDICASSTTSPASGGHLSPLKGGTSSPALTVIPEKDAVIVRADPFAELLPDRPETDLCP